MTETLGQFRLRASTWMEANLPRLPDGYDNRRLDLEDPWGKRSRRLQRLLFDAGFAGLCFPKEYKGQGLDPSYQQAFTEVSRPYQMPTLFNVPTLSILAPTLLDFGTEAQKLLHIPAILRGDELWVQFLSEPTGGSDLAGVMTRATPDGDAFILNGSKIWSSGAFRSDFAMCLARTDWGAPKHRGLTMFILKIHQPGVEVRRIRMVNGTAEFCQEFFDDLVVPASDVLGEVNQGWTVATRLLFYERQAVAGASPYTSGVALASRGSEWRTDLVELARATGQWSEPRVRHLVAEAHVNDRVQEHLGLRLAEGIRLGALPPAASAIGRLGAAMTGERRTDIGMEISASRAGAWLEGDPAGSWGQAWLARQGGSLGGGSSEMQRNIIAERVLGMPREWAADRDKPFEQVRRNVPPSR